MGPFMQSVPLAQSSGIEVTAGRIKPCQHRSPVGQAARSQSVKEFQIGNLDLAPLGATQHEGIVRLPPDSTPVAQHRAATIANRTAGERHKRRHRPAPPLPRHDRSEVGLVAGGTGRGTGQANRLGDQVIAVEIHIAADNGQPVASLGQFREQFAEDQAGRSGGDASKRAPILGRGLRLGVAQIEMTGAAPQPEHQHRLRGTGPGQGGRPQAGTKK